MTTPADTLREAATDKCFRHDYEHREYVCTCTPHVPGDSGRDHCRCGCVLTDVCGAPNCTAPIVNGVPLCAHQQVTVARTYLGRDQ